MSMWGYGPFDNDTGADLAGDLRDLPGLGERVKLITEVLSELLNGPSPGPADLAVHSLGWRMEQAMAAAAIVADAQQGEMRFTAAVSARGLTDGDELGDPPAIGTPDAALVELAFKAAYLTALYMKSNGASRDWVENVVAVREALTSSARTPTE